MPLDFFITNLSLCVLEVWPTDRRFMESLALNANLFSMHIIIFCA